MEEKIKISKDLIPIITVIFLICNFIFNLGYYHFDIKFMGLLTLSDYFEGTTYVALITIILSIVVFSCTQYNKKTLEQVQNIEQEVSNIENTILNDEIKIPYNKYQDINHIKNDCKQIILQNLFMSFVTMFILFIILIFLFHISFVWLIFPFLFLIPQYLYIKAKYFNGNIYFIIFCFFMYLCGGMSTFQINYSQDKEIVNANNNYYYLIRPISKGAIVKSSDNNIVFINNADITDITVDLKKIKRNK